jgi:hypothetical protein
MFIRILKFRKTQGATQVVWSTGIAYSNLVGKCFEMAIWKTEEIGVYNDEDKCHMTNCWPFKS